MAAAVAAALSGAVAPAGGVARAAKPTTAAEVSPAKALLTAELNLLDRELAAHLMRRAELTPDRRGRNELEIDLRVIERALIALAGDAKFDTNEQAGAWLRAKHFRDAARGLTDALAGADPTGGSPSQREAVAQLHKLSFQAAELKAGQLDPFCRAAAVALANLAGANPVSPASLVTMRPAPLAAAAGDPKDRPPTVGELSDQVQRLGAISIPLRQQLLALAGTAGGATDANEARALTGVLAQAVGLARGLQNNTAVGPEQRTAIEVQLAEGLALHSDPRTRDAGRGRVEALGQYRQTLTRIGRMGLTGEQMSQFAPAFAWAQAAPPETGAKVMAALEAYVDLGAKWDAQPREAAVPTALRRPLEDVRGQFAKARGQFAQDVARVGAAGGPAALEQSLDEMRRLSTVAGDLQAMGHGFEVINGYKVKPAGGLEKKVLTAALAAAAPAPSPTRSDGQRYLESVRTLVHLSDRLGGRPLGNDVPTPVAQAWAGGAVTPFEGRWRAIVADLAGGLVSGSLELDKGKALRLETAVRMADALRAAAEFEAALGKAPALTRWADWAIDPAALAAVVQPYKDATAQAFVGYASDNLDKVDYWGKAHTRYHPLIALLLRDVAYAEACEKLPIGLAADVSRLATNLENAPFATERFASATVGVLAALERTGDVEAADKVAVTLAKRLTRDLRLEQKVDESATRLGRSGGK